MDELDLNSDDKTPGYSLNARKGEWIETYTGRAMYPLDPRIDEIELADISQSLSMKTRFNGMSRRFYSVAEHAVRCATYALQATRDENFALALLHHDSAEAYLPDVPRPIKPYLTNFQRIEDGIAKVIYEKFRIRPLDVGQQKHLKKIDDILLATEARDLMTEGAVERWNLPQDPLPAKIIPWRKKRAKLLFNLWHDMLTHQKTDNLALYALDLLGEYGAIKDGI